MRPNLISAIIAILFAFICLFLFFKFSGPIPFFVQNVNTSKETLFTVHGEGETSVIPDTALISLGVTKTASTVGAAQNQVNQIANSITQDLKSLGIEVKDIKTTNYSIRPNYDYRTSRQTITGYTVTTNMQVKIKPIDKADQAIDRATTDGANAVGSIQFIVDDEMQKKLEHETRQKAIEDAKAQARSIADAAGIRLGRIVDVQESGQNFYKNQQYGGGALFAPAADEADTTTNLNPGENKITSNVTISYETY